MTEQKIRRAIEQIVKGSEEEKERLYRRAVELWRADVERFAREVNEVMLRAADLQACGSEKTS